MTEQQRKSIDEIMDWFDFDKVHRAMRTLRWVWSSSNGVPSLPEIRQFARELMTSSIEGNTSHSSGGFQVTYDQNDNYLRLEFIISSFEVFHD